MSEEVAVHELPATDFPLTIEFFDSETKEIYHTILVDGPGSIIVPPKPDYVQEADVRLIFPDGKVMEG